MLPTINQILSTRPDPLGVLSSTAYAVAQARHVSFDRVQVERIAHALGIGWSEYLFQERNAVGK